MAGASAEWEDLKENLVPLKSGRTAAELGALKLTDNLTEHQSRIEQQRAAFESEISSYSGEDPLEIWVRYVKWAQHELGGNQKAITALLERCAREFKKDARYKNDPRYLRIWVAYADSCADPGDVFTYLVHNRIGEYLALFYEAHALVLEAKGCFSAAEEVYKVGVARNAQPVERLRKRYDDFHERMKRRMQRRDEEQELVARSGPPVAVAEDENGRPILNPLSRAAASSSTRPTTRAPARGVTAGPAQVARSGRSAKPEGGLSFAVFEDGPGPEAQRPAEPMMEMPSETARHKENAPAVSRWNEVRLPGTKRPRCAPSAAPFTVHEDPPAEPASAPAPAPPAPPRQEPEQAAGFRRELLDDGQGGEQSFEEARAAWLAARPAPPEPSPAPAAAPEPSPAPAPAPAPPRPEQAPASAAPPDPPAPPASAPPPAATPAQASPPIAPRRLFGLGAEPTPAPLGKAGSSPTVTLFTRNAQLEIGSYWRDELDLGPGPAPAPATPAAPAAPAADFAIFEDPEEAAAGDENAGRVPVGTGRTLAEAEAAGDVLREMSDGERGVRCDAAAAPPPAPPAGPVDPFEAEERAGAALRAGLAPGQYEGLYDAEGGAGGSGGEGTILTLAGRRLVLRGELGRGSRGLWRQAFEEGADEPVAVKLAAEADPLELHAALAAAARLPPALRPLLAGPHEMHLGFGPDGRGAALVARCGAGPRTLLDAAASLRPPRGGPPDEGASMLLACEVLRAVEALHAAGILHCGLTPARLLMRTPSTALQLGPWAPRGETRDEAWEALGVAVAGFGRAVDSALYGPEARFTGRPQALPEAACCPAMLAAGLWSFEADAWAAAAAIHEAFLGGTLEVDLAPDGRRASRRPLPPKWAEGVWGAALAALLNAGCGREASAAALAAARGALEAHLAASPLRARLHVTCNKLAIKLAEM